MTLVYLTLAWLAGILVSYLLWPCEPPGSGVFVRWILLSSAGSVVVAAVCLRHRYQRCGLAALLLAATLGGTARYLLQPLYPLLTPEDLAWYHSADEPLWATVEGVITDYPDVRDQTTLYQVSVDSLSQDGISSAVAGLLLVMAPRYPEHQYGDRIRISGQIRTPDPLEEFDYRAYLARRRIHSIARRPSIDLLDTSTGSPVWSALYRFRARASGALNRLLPEPAAALANGILLGIDSGIPDDLSSAFEATGTTHVIVISGSNIALLSGVLLALLSRAVGRRRATLPTIAGIVLYVLLVGADAAAVRAGCMGILFVLAIALGRQNTAIVSLFSSALLMTAVNPLTLWDVGFQLSLLATLGLILFSGPIRAWFQRIGERLQISLRLLKSYEIIADLLAVTLAAQAMTLPLTMLHFGRLSLITLLANLLIGPVQPLIMAGGLVALGLGLVWQTLGRLVAFLPWLLISYMVVVVRAAAAVPWSAVDTGSLGRIASVAYYGVMIGVFASRRVTGAFALRVPVRSMVAWAVVIGLLLGLGGSAMAMRSDGLLHLYYPPSEYGEGALILDPDRRCIGLDDGSGGAWLAGISGGLPCRKGHPGDLWIGASLPTGWEQATLISTSTIEPGAQLHGTGGWRLQLTQLDGSQIWFLDHANFRTLIPAALSQDEQASLRMGSIPSLTMLKLPGRAAGQWPSPALLDAASPQVILWPEDTSYPPASIRAIEAFSVVRVSPEATVEIITDGKQFWMRSLMSSPHL